MKFEWDEKKNEINIKKHGISFFDAQYSFADPHRVIAEDTKHSTEVEKRYYCFGKSSKNIITTRFTYRNGVIRIIGAGFWREGRKIYGQQNNKIH